MAKKAKTTKQQRQDDDDDDRDEDDSEVEPKGGVKSQAEANAEAASPDALRKDDTVDKDSIPAGPGQEGFDAPTASAGPAHTADPGAAVAAASVEGSTANPGAPPAAELDPTNKPLPPGHKDTVVPRNPQAMFSAHPKDAEADEIADIRKELAKLTDRVNALAIKRGK